VLDEAASLGHLESIDDAVDKYRGFGIRLIFLFQSLAQLKKCFPEGQEQTLLSNASQIFFGINDNTTAEYVSARLGEYTAIVESGSTGRSYQRTSGGGSPHGSTSYSTNTNSSWAQQARKLLKPEELMALPPRTAITFTPGLRPICTTLIRYYEEPALFRRPGRARRFIRSCWWAVQSFGGLLGALVIAGGLTITLHDAQRPGLPRPAGITKTLIRHR
jgi:type IV secretion system protein VirD4